MAALDFEAPVKTKTEESTKTSLSKGHTYMTVLATVQDGKILLPQNIEFPDNTPVLITILQEEPKEIPPADYENYTDEEFDNMTVGEQIIAGLKDIRAGRTTRIETEEDLERFLDRIEEG